jgi:hypothetical protein
VDKKIKILCILLLIILVGSMSAGYLRDGIEKKRGTLGVTNIGLSNDSQGLNGGYSIECEVKNLVSLRTLRMMTVYYDKYDNKLAESPFAFNSGKELLSNQETYVNEELGYDSGGTGVKPAKVCIYFFSQDFSSKPIDAIYYTSLKF